jgi:DNA-binding winged helix-turn-helix (wHTH) protein/tetratricopeptide (TPR) repeat protein
VDPEFGNVHHYRFGVFELDLDSSTLRNRSGAVVRLQQQPFRLLALLVSRHGELIAREDIRKHLWSDETFVDFEHSVNFCVRQIRSALGDDAKVPRYIETVPRKGYRFIAAVEGGELQEAGLAPLAPRPFRRSAVAGIGLIGLATFLFVTRYWSPDRTNSAVAVADGAVADANLGTEILLAREAYIKGRYLWQKGTNTDLEQALSHFDDAVRLDPGFAAAYAAMADTYQLLANQGARAPREAFPRARLAAEKALSLSPTLAEAKMVLGTVLFRFDWNWKDAETSLRQAVEMNPTSAAARHDYAWFLISMKRSDEGIAQIRKAHELDPLSLRANVDIGWALLRAGQIDEAIIHLRRILELEPEFAGAQHCLEVAYTFKGMYSEALDFARRALTRSGVDIAGVPGAGQADPRLALESIWRRQLQDLEQQSGVSANYRIASYYALLGDRDQAFTWLNRAFEARDPSLVAVHLDQSFQTLHDDPRFDELLRRVGLL